MSAWRMAAVLGVLVWAAGCGAKEPAGPNKSAEQNPPSQNPAAVGTEPAVEPAPEAPVAPSRDLTRIKTDIKAKSITIEGRFCLAEGILDYLAVVSGGREYESVLALDVKASVLHANLLAIGAEPGPTEEILAEMRKNPPKDAKIPERVGTALRVVVTWKKDDGTPVSMSATRLMASRPTKAPAEDAPWIFTGSYFAKHPDTGEQVYMGDFDEALLAVRYIPSAVANFSKDRGNPYDGMDTGYEVNSGIIPKPGVPCTVIISLWDAPAERAK